MGRVKQDVQFHHKGNALRLNISTSSENQVGSHELDAQTMRYILTQLLAKTIDTKKKQKENPHHHYEAVFKEVTNIDKPPIANHPQILSFENQPPQESTTGQSGNNKEILENSTKCVIFLDNSVFQFIFIKKN